jgi:NAD(P)-dependent dehydrogenase (short-subunit alcohol dehydrogenase family)
VDRLVDSVRQRFGVVDILVNNAGVAPSSVRRNFVVEPVRFWEHTEEHTQNFFAVNAIAPFRLAVHLAPDMVKRGWGRIISVTTSLGSMLRAGMAGYAGSKAALEAHTAVLAGDLADTGVTANVLIPGGAANTPLVPLESGVDRAQLIQPEAMVAPRSLARVHRVRWCDSQALIAAYWDTTLPASAAVANAIVPIGWSGLGEQTIFPANYVQAR